MVDSVSHISVLLDEVVQGVMPQPGGRYIDATCGFGGHTESLLIASAPDGQVMAIDRDPCALALAKSRLQNYQSRVTLVQGNFSDILDHAEQYGFMNADGIVADLGVSSMQLDEAERGFSFMRDGPLDMRMGPDVGPALTDLLSVWSEKELTTILKEYGELPRARRIAQAIVTEHKKQAIVTTFGLLSVVEPILGPRRPGASHPATRVFQALRIAVNDELGELRTLLEQMKEVLRDDARAAIISFHSLEDRIVKRAFEDPPAPDWPKGLPGAPPRRYGAWQNTTKKPIVSKDQELSKNSRARSAKLRVAVRRPRDIEGQVRT